PDPVRVRFHERYAVIRKLRAILPAEIDLKTECFAVEIEVHDNEGVIGREQTRIELQKPGAPEPMNCYSRSSSHDFLLLFHHLEKTAGTTIRHVIARQYEQDEIYYLYNGEPQFRGFEDFKLLSAEDQQRINVILGHNTRHAGSYLHRDYRAATFLRNPIDRLLSLYAFVKRHKETPLNRVLHEHKLGFTDFVTRIHELSGIGYAGVDNSLVRKISGVDARIGHCHEGMLEVAIDKVDREFAVVGLVERFDESLLMMRRAFGWRTPFYRKSNVSKNRKKRTELSDADMEKIRPYSELDIRLYEYCATRLQQQIDAAGESFAKELTEFQAANAYSANWLEE
ncbi:MAG: sulfotransferase family 2 domain-containing protein, partial [bacterium]